MTIKEWFSLHPDPRIRTRLLKLCTNPDQEVTDSCSAIGCGFTWSKTKEGPGYWRSQACLPWGPGLLFRVTWYTGQETGYCRTLLELPDILTDDPHYTFHLYPGEP